MASERFSDAVLRALTDYDTSAYLGFPYEVRCAAREVLELRAENAELRKTLGRIAETRCSGAPFDEPACPERMAEKFWCGACTARVLKRSAVDAMPTSKPVCERCGDQLADAEVICEFMEPRPVLPDCYCHLLRSPKEWWILVPTLGGGMEWLPDQLTLDRLWEVEEALKRGVPGPGTPTPLWDTYGIRMGWYATAGQKIKALAAVIRERNGQ